MWCNVHEWNSVIAFFAYMICFEQCSDCNVAKFPKGSAGALIVSLGSSGPIKESQRLVRAIEICEVKYSVAI